MGKRWKEEEWSIVGDPFTAIVIIVKLVDPKGYNYLVANARMVDGRDDWLDEGWEALSTICEKKYGTGVWKIEGIQRVVNEKHGEDWDIEGMDYKISSASKLCDVE